MIVIKIVKKVLAYRGFFEISKMQLSHRKFDGTMTPVLTREVVIRDHAVAVLPYDPVTDRVLLIRQFLIGAHVAGVDNRPLQVIAGMIEEDQTPEEAATRETEEEAGLKVSKLIPAQNFLPSPGGSSERVHTYLAVADLTDAGGIHGLEAEGEDIRVEVMSARDAIRMLDRGEIEAGPAVVLLSWFARRRAQQDFNPELLRMKFPLSSSISYSASSCQAPSGQWDL